MGKIIMSQMSIPSVQLEQPQMIRTNAQANLYNEIGQDATTTAQAAEKGIGEVINAQKLNELKGQVYDKVADDLKQKGETNQGVLNAAKAYISTIKDPDHLGQAMKAYSIQSQQYDQYVNSLPDEQKPIAQRLVSKPVFGSQELPNFESSKQALQKVIQSGVAQNIQSTQAGTERGAIQNAPTEPAPAIGENQQPMVSGKPIAPEGNIPLERTAANTSSPMKSGMALTPSRSATNMMDEANNQQTDLSTPPQNVSATDMAEAYSAKGVPVGPEVAAKEKEETLGINQQKNEGLEGYRQALIDSSNKKIDQTEEKIKETARHNQAIEGAKNEFNAILRGQSSIKFKSLNNSQKESQINNILKGTGLKLQADKVMIDPNYNLLASDEDKQQLQTDASDINALISSLTKAEVTSGSNVGKSLATGIPRVIDGDNSSYEHIKSGSLFYDLEGNIRRKP
jgi:hypothetical protein